ncbi:MAG: hypothetical protein LPK03_04400 [Pontibacter sp.]|nr:hypothetical protein [Pontibacter sp.]
MLKTPQGGNQIFSAGDTLLVPPKAAPYLMKQPWIRGGKAGALKSTADACVGSAVSFVVT